MDLKIRLVFVVFSWVICAILPFNKVFAQQLLYPELAISVDLSSAFNRSHTHIAIPAGGNVYTYGPPAKGDTSNAWRLIESTVIPKGTIAIDGNIRKLHFLAEDRVIFKEYSDSDTLVFDKKLLRIDPRLWVRTPYSTEKDVSFIENGKQVTYYTDGGEWFIVNDMSPQFFRKNKTVPPVDGQQFNKLYSFEQREAQYVAAVYGDQIRFHRYKMVFDELNAQAPKPKHLDFQLPAGALSAFVYDRMYLGVVFSERILFYQFDRDMEKWVPYSRLKPFVLTDFPENK